MIVRVRNPNPLVPWIFPLLLAALLAGCASGGAEPVNDKPPPPNSPLAKVEMGSSDVEVRKVMGDPDDANGYMTGKAWIPFYYGGDTHRTDWLYKGQGRVVFSRNRWSGNLKVIRVIYNPNDAL